MKDRSLKRIRMPIAYVRASISGLLHIDMQGRTGIAMRVLIAIPAATANAACR